MQIWGVTREYAEAVAQDLGFRLDNVRPSSNGFKCVLRPISGDKSTRFRRTSASIFHGGRRVNAVCYHGHYAWMKSLLLHNPHGRIKSSMFDYKGLGEFNANAYDVGYRNIGSMYCPTSLSDACLCDESERDNAYEYVYSGVHA